MNTNIFFQFTFSSSHDTINELFFLLVNYQEIWFNQNYNSLCSEKYIVCAYVCVWEVFYTMMWLFRVLKVFVVIQTENSLKMPRCMEYMLKYFCLFFSKGHTGCIKKKLFLNIGLKVHACIIFCKTILCSFIDCHMA